MQSLLEHIPTRDGGTVACKHKPGAGSPVIFVHGLAVNADVWDIPQIRGDGFVFRSLASRLAERGHDIWLVNLRGHGGPHMLSRPPAGQTDWCVDHFILFDLPAVVEHVQRVTGKPALLIGSSMGAMTIAGYLQGAVLIGYGAMQMIVADEAAARQRRKMVSGCVLMEMPAALRWQQSLYDERGDLKWADLLRDWRSTESGQNYPFEWLARAGWVHLMMDTLGQIRLDWLRPGARVESREIAVDSTQAARGFSERVKRQAMKFFSDHFKGAKNFCPETFLDGLLYAVDHVKAGVLRQMGKSVRAGGFVSGLGSPDHVYSDFYDEIASPALIIVGGRDRIASAAVTREVLFDRIGGTDKAFLVFDDLAHGEFEYSPAASELVYPQVVEWIARRVDQRDGAPALTIES